MKIKKLNISSFGKLSSKEIEFSDKITVITADNEAGKSTIASFIKFMLYGFNKKSRDVAENDKKKYMPWTSDKAYGSMSITVNDERFVIERECSSKNVVRIRNSISEQCYAGNEPGDVFLKTDFKTYEKTAFVGQNDIAVTKTDGVSEALQNIAFSADENISSESALKKLNAYRNELYNKSRKTGKIFELEKECSELRMMRDSLSENHKKLLVSEKKLEDTRENIAKNEEIVAKCTQELYDFQCYEAHLVAEELKTLREKEKASSELYLSLCEKYPFDNSFKDSLNNIAQSLKDAQIRYRRADEQYEKALSDYNASSEASPEFKCFDGIDTVHKEREIRGKSDIIASYTKKAIIFTCLIITIPFAVYCWLKATRAKNELLKELQEFGCNNCEEFSKLLSAFMEYEKCNAEKLAVLNFHRINLDAEKGILDEKILAAQEICSSNDTDSSSLLLQLSDKFEYVNNALNEKSQSKDTLNSYTVRIDTLLKTHNSDEIAEMSKNFSGRIPEREKREIERELKFYSSALQCLRVQEAELDKSSSVITSTMPNPAELESKIELTEKQLAQYITERDAIELAINYIEEACLDIRKNLSPRLTEKASELFSRITSGKYDCLNIDSEFNLSFTEKSDLVSRDSGFLSVGASDLAYICLRFALIEYMYDEKPVVVFDDAFVRFDDKRLVLMLELLKELSDEYQIVILSCHNREAEILSDFAKILKL